jgi:hypothetical protein
MKVGMLIAYLHLKIKRLSLTLLCKIRNMLKKNHAGTATNSFHNQKLLLIRQQRE